MDGVDPLRNPNTFRCAWVAKNYKGAFIHEIGHLFGARSEFIYHNFQSDFFNVQQMNFHLSQFQLSFGKMLAGSRKRDSMNFVQA